MSLKHGWVGVSVAALLLGAWAVSVRAADGEGETVTPAGEPEKVQQDRAAEREKIREQKRAERAAGFDGLGLLGQALNKLELQEPTKAKAVEATKQWKAQQLEAAGALKEKRKALAAQAEAEQDKEKKLALKKQLAELKEPTDQERYESLKVALKDILSADLLTKLDELVKAGQTESLLKNFDGMIASFAKGGVELDDAQKTKTAAVRTKLAEDLAKLAPGAMNEGRKLMMTAVWDVRKNVLTAEQQAKLVAAAQAEKEQAAERERAAEKAKALEAQRREREKQKEEPQPDQPQPEQPKPEGDGQG